MLNSNDWKNQSPEFQHLENTRSTISMFGKAQILNSNVWKSENPQFQSLEKTGTSIPVIGKAQILNAIV